MEDIFGMLNFWGGDSTVFYILSALFFVCIPYGIYSIPFMVLCTICILRVVSVMLYRLAYFGLLFLSLVGLTMCSFNEILRICGCGLISGEELLVV